MPIFRITKSGSNQGWALWKISETEPELASLSERCPPEIIHPRKRLEWMAGRALLGELAKACGIPYHGTGKDQFGKPLLKGHNGHISLSHSFPWVAAQLAIHHPVGIDVEQPRSKLKVVAPRVFSPAEVRDAGGDVVKLCVYWSAKEALYKYYGKRELLFTDHLAIEPFILDKEGVLTGTIDIEGTKKVVPLHYLVLEDLVLVFTTDQT